MSINKRRFIIKTTPFMWQNYSFYVAKLLLLCGKTTPLIVTTLQSLYLFLRKRKFNYNYLKVEENYRNICYFI